MQIFKETMNALEMAVQEITASVDVSRNIIQEIDQTRKNIIAAGRKTASHQKHLTLTNEEALEAAKFGEHILSG